MCNYIYGFIPPSGVCSEGPDAVYCFLSKEGGDLFWIRTGRREGMFGSNLDLIAIGSFRAAHSFFCIIIIQAGLNYDVPQGDFGPGTVYQCVDENAVRLDLDDLGGEIVRIVLCSLIIIPASCYAAC